MGTAMFCLSESAENGQSTTHGWRSSRFPPGTVLWTQTRQAMSTYGGEVPRGVLGVDEHQVHSTGRVYTELFVLQVPSRALRDLGMRMWQQAGVAWLGKKATMPATVFSFLPPSAHWLVWCGE